MTNTSLRRWEPFRDLASLRSDVERMFRPMWDDTVAVTWFPALDVEETDDGFVLHIEVPGIKADELDLSLDDDVLTVSGERKFYEEKDEEGFRRVERSFGSFHRSVRLPAHVDAEKVEATYADGILTVTVPKVEEAKPHRITVTAN